MRRLIIAVSSGSTLFDVQFFNLHINFFPSNNLFKQKKKKKKKKSDDKCRLKFGSERVKGTRYIGRLFVTFCKGDSFCDSLYAFLFMRRSDK